jgi:hypothetical protein
MARDAAFQALGQTYKCAVTTSTQTISITPDGVCQQYLVANHQPTGTGGQPVYLRFSTSSSVTAAVPVTGTPSYCFVSVPGTIKAFTGPPSSPSQPLYVAFIGEGASECYITPGEGI